MKKLFLFSGILICGFLSVNKSVFANHLYVLSFDRPVKDELRTPLQGQGVEFGDYLGNVDISDSFWLGCIAMEG